MNYIGSKFSLLNFLYESISKVVGDLHEGLVFADMFAGAGSVGKFFKKKGCKIIANDIQYYSYVLNRQYIGNNCVLLFRGLEDEIPVLRNVMFDEDRAKIVCQFLDGLPATKGFLYENYCKGGHSENENYRLYFSDMNGGRCDSIRIKIEEWYSKGLIYQDEYFFLLATLIENIDKVANTASVYGAFLKKLKTAARRPLVMRPTETILNQYENRVYNCDANDLICDITTDILYLDPPYNQRQYGANYHLLETIARYDNPELKGKTGMRDYHLQKSEYCSRSKVASAFERLIDQAKAKYIFLSYNNEGLMSIDTIRSIMSKRGFYGCFERRYNRFRADVPSEKRQIKADSTVEFLHYVIID